MYSKSMDQRGKVANPAGGQLNRENGYSPVPVRASEFGLARRVQLSRPEFRGGVHLFVQNRHTSSGHAIAYRWRSLPRVLRHRATKPQGSSERVLPCRSPWTN